MKQRPDSTRDRNLEQKVLWIAWERHRRTLELSDFFGIPLFAYSSRQNRLIRYLLFTAKTVGVMVKLRPTVLIVQNPSAVLTLLSCLLKKILCFRLVVDTHNAAILPEDRFLRKLSFFYKLFQRCADVTVVTNDELAQVVSDNGGIPFVMPDRLPRTVIKDGKALQGTFNIVCICTFGTDEPFEQLVHAARAFPEGVIFHFTGDDARVVDTDIYRGRPRNVLFTGFISDDAYWQLLGAADLVVDLTKRQSCLVCGAYEAVAAGVPMLLSDTRALREYFYKGAVFSGNSAPELVENITYAMRTKNRLKEEVADLKKEIDRAWPKLAAEFLTVLDR